jgi:hypothetical protein
MTQLIGVLVQQYSLKVMIVVIGAIVVEEEKLIIISRMLKVKPVD